jgi:hypothetical protein
MVPKIIFQRSWIYDHVLEPLRGVNFKMPSEKDIKQRVTNIERGWKMYGPKLLKEMARITRLSWHQKITTCYLVTGIKMAWSDPLTMNTRKDPRGAIHTLTHEMIHRLFSEEENDKKIDQNWKTFLRKYPKEDILTKNHIFLQAVHEHLLRKFFNEQELKGVVAFDQKNPLYARSWEIVNKEGYQTILAQLTKD